MSIAAEAVSVDPSACLGRAQGDCVVSVVIVSWNTRELLRNCIASTLDAARLLDGPAEIIVVDNDSHDGTTRMLSDEFPGVRVIGNRANVGFAAANNQGIRQARGRYLLLLNPDTTCSPGSLSTLIAFLQDAPAAGAVGPRLLGRDGEHQVSCFPLPTLAREMWRLFHLDRVYGLASYPLTWWRSDDARQVESIQGACMLIRREALQQTGLLDERFFIYTEEIDLCRRLVDAGWQIVWVPQAIVTHYGAASTEQVAARMFVELYRSKIAYFRKHLGRWGAVGYKAVLIAATIPRLGLTPLVMACVPSRRDRCRGVLRNYSSLLVRLPVL